MLVLEIVFQSTPVIANGRIVEADSLKITINGFNPRPLLLTGESLINYPQKVWAIKVSIHARYC